jgi:hypothetical protein
MGRLIATTQATVDGVIDPVAEWVQPDGDHGEYSLERQARSGGLVLGRKTLIEGDLEDSISRLKDEVAGDLFMHGSGEFAYTLAETSFVHDDRP